MQCYLLLPLNPHETFSHANVNGIYQGVGRKALGGRKGYLVEAAENAKNYILPLSQTKALGERSTRRIRNVMMGLPRLSSLRLVGGIHRDDDNEDDEDEKDNDSDGDGDGKR
ncbi:hypothetical protein ACLKA6_013933 [Drosophila palustris]